MLGLILIRYSEWGHHDRFAAEIYRSAAPFAPFADSQRLRRLNRHAVMAEHLNQPKQLAPPREFAAGASAKRPVVGPTSRPLRIPFQDSPVPVEAGPPPVLDPGILVDLCVALPFGQVREFVTSYIADTEFQLTEIASHRARGDLLAVARVARNIAANARYLGALYAGSFASQLEATCRMGETAGSYHLIGELSQACQSAGESMQAWLNGQANRFGRR
jgi:HPt (histidine-containing phosphotransfer) domain-containing protein